MGITHPRTSRLFENVFWCVSMIWYAVGHESVGTESGDECAVVAQLVEHVLGKNEASGSIPDNGSRGLAEVVQGQNITFVK